MKDMELRFTGSVPANYDQLMVPLIFQPYANELARRAREIGPMRILETAAGTGVVTQALHEACPDAEIIATDLNEPMLEVANERFRSDKVCFITANAQELPFDGSGFDLVICQFGAMFFPDRILAHKEARRVLRADSRYLLAIWDDISRNALSDATQRVLIDLFPDDPPLFLCDGPFSYSDPTRIDRDLRAAGFSNVEIETVQFSSRSPSARDAAAALCYGTPMSVELQDRAPGSLDRAFKEVERSLRSFEGPNGVDAPMSAHIVTATK